MIIRSSFLDTIYVYAFLILLFAGLVLPGHSQSLQLQRIVTIPTPVSISTDRYDHVYLADQAGNLFKYDSLGSLLHSYSPPRPTRITSMDASNSIQVFIFSSDVQSYTWLDRYLTPTGSAAISLRHPEIGFARALTPATNQLVWLYDDTDVTLKKYDPELHQVQIRTSLPAAIAADEFTINFMREYQNRLYVNSQNQNVLVFDNLGNYVQPIPVRPSAFFGFRGDELYYLTNNALHFFHLYARTQRRILLPTTARPFTHALVLRHRLVLFTANEMRFYRINHP